MGNLCASDSMLGSYLIHCIDNLIDNLHCLIHFVENRIDFVHFVDFMLYFIISKVKSI